MFLKEDKTWTDYRLKLLIVSITRFEFFLINSDVKKPAKSARPGLGRFGPGRPGLGPTRPGLARPHRPEKKYFIFIFLMYYL